MRALCIAIVLLLCGCSAAAQTPSSTNVAHGRAYVDVARALRSDPLSAALANDDRQIATLARTLDDRALSARPASVDLSSARASLARLASAAAHAPVAIDESALQRSILRTSAAQSAAVGANARAAQASYVSALNAEQRARIAALASALNVRVAQAYALRAQALREQESNDAVTRDEAVAGRQASLRAKADAALAPQRAVEQRELTAIAASLAGDAAAERRRDDATLAAYASRVRSAAWAQYARTVAQLTANDRANLALRERVTSAQQTEPKRSPLPVSASYSGTMQHVSRNLSQAANGSRAQSTHLQQAISGAQSSMQSESADVGAQNHADRLDAQRELERMREDRAALYARIVDSIQRQARTLARARHLRLTSQRNGAIDLTPEVSRALEARFGG